MECADRLAIVGIVSGLRQSGIIDRQAVKTIVETLVRLASQSREHCSYTADELITMASLMEQGPLKSCIGTVTPEAIASMKASHAYNGSSDSSTAPH